MNTSIRMEKTKRDFHSTTYYVNAVRNETVKTNHPQQRESGQWTPEYRDGLIGTILKNEDIPYIVICEQITDKGIDNFLIDGIQRITTIYNYRKGLFKLGKKVERPVIEYETNVLDENGKKKRDDDGDLIREIKGCDIRGKGYEDLPRELQEIFDEYQLMEVKHLNCSDEQIGYHLRRYNHARKMGASQNGITYLDKKIAMRVKEITATHTFFKDLGNFTPTEKNNDTLNRVVLESMMSTYFIDCWKSPLRDISSYLNEHLEEEMLTCFEKELDSISAVMTKKAANMFTSKNSFLWFTVYHKFAETGLDAGRFVEFMEEFNNSLHCKKWNGKTFDSMNKVSTKKKSSIIEKLQLLEVFMREYLSADVIETESKTDVLKFLKTTVNAKVGREDMEFYNDILEDLTLNVDNTSSLLDKCNRPSLIAVVGYACDHDLDLDAWIVEFFQSNSTYMKDQKENFLYMKEHLLNYCQSAVNSGKKL